MTESRLPTITVDPWRALRQHTTARIALGRAGASLPTTEVLRFGLDHARARDAVHAALDVSALIAEVASLGRPPLHVRSRAPDRATYLLRPDLGRSLAPTCRSTLTAAAPGGDGCDIAVILADGLSATALQRHAAPLLTALWPRLSAAACPAPVVIATQARVALGDEIGAALGARLALMLIGERPGLSAPDSLGAYLTWQPRPGRTDAERNCVSNIRPEGLDFAAAAVRILWLCQAALHRRLTGVALKDDSAEKLLPQ